MSREENVMKVIREVIGKEQIDENEDLFENGLDSLGVLVSTSIGRNHIDIYVS